MLNVAATFIEIKQSNNENVPENRFIVKKNSQKQRKDKILTQQ